MINKSLYGKKKKLPFSINTMITGIIFLVFLACILYGFSDVSTSAKEQQLEIAQKAVERAAIQCYAIEGRYPPDLSYLESHYGIILDTGHFLYHYERFGSNLMPEIKVFELEQGE